MLVGCFITYTKEMIMKEANVRCNSTTQATFAIPREQMDVLQISADRGNLM